MDWFSVPISRIVWIDTSFSNEEQEEIIRAFRSIECSTNYSLVKFEFVKNASLSDTFSMKMSPGIVVINTTSNDPRIKNWDNWLSSKNKDKKITGLYLVSEPIPTILIPRDRTNIHQKERFYQVIIHEAIHASFNIITHSESNHAVMNATMEETDAKGITREDLEFICESYHCDASQFEVCNGE